MADKKAEFRKYLETSGVMDAIVKSLVELYQEPERPADPLAFVVNRLGGSVGTGANAGAMASGGAATNQGCEEKDRTIEELREKVETLERQLQDQKGAAPAVAAAAVMSKTSVAPEPKEILKEAEKAPAEKAPAEKAPAEKAPAEKSPSENGAQSEKDQSEKAPSKEKSGDKTE